MVGSQLTIISLPSLYIVVQCLYYLCFSFNLFLPIMSGSGNIYFEVTSFNRSSSLKIVVRLSTRAARSHRFTNICTITYLMVMMYLLVPNSANSDSCTSGHPYLQPCRASLYKRTKLQCQKRLCSRSLVHFRSDCRKNQTAKSKNWLRKPLIHDDHSPHYTAMTPIRHLKALQSVIRQLCEPALLFAWINQSGLQARKTQVTTNCPRVRWLEV